MSSDQVVLRHGKEPATFHLSVNINTDHRHFSVNIEMFSYGFFESVNQCTGENVTEICVWVPQLTK